MVGQLGTTHRYICSAKYEEAGEAKYLIREVYSNKRDKELKQAVIELFIKDLESGGRPVPENETERERKAREMTRVYLTGKLSDLSIEELKDEMKR